MARGVNGQEIFLDDADRHRFLRAVSDVKGEAPFSVLSYCLMGNHFHSAIRVKRAPLSVVMQRILTSYSMAFNRRHARTGHLFQARYRSCLCRNDAYLLALRNYIHRNPVRAGLCSAPHRWRWSSAYERSGPDQLIDHAELAALDLEGTAPLEEEFDPWLEPDEDARLGLTRLDAEKRPALDEIAKASFDSRSREILRQGGKRPAVVAMKRLFAEAAAQRGHALTDVARCLGCSVSTAYRWQLQRIENRKA